ncbi:MAG: hypothetical protein LBS95_00545 [Mycoplasmataceae bacterium]|jgi:hypothetical protein|nr:hypothetical protein [Mycoplasmataceae bacterium]
MTRKYRIKNAKNNKQLIGDEIELETIIKRKMNKILDKTIIVNKKPNAVNGKRKTLEEKITNAIATIVPQLITNAVAPVMMRLDGIDKRLDNLIKNNNLKE